MPYPNLDKLKSTLQASGIQQQNPALFQVINQLIDALRQSNLQTGVVVATSVPSLIPLLSRTYLTATDETAILPNSRELLAGLNISFDDTVPGERTVNATGGSGTDREWGVLTDGDPIEPEIIFAGGDVVMTHIP